LVSLSMWVISTLNPFVSSYQSSLLAQIPGQYQQRGHMDFPLVSIRMNLNTKMTKKKSFDVRVQVFNVLAPSCQRPCTSTTQM
jgi:hypothetical protein